MKPQHLILSEAEPVFLSAISWNNPGNLRPGETWQGIDGIVNTGSGQFLRFESMFYGTRAMMKLLFNYGPLRGAYTTETKVPIYAPAGDGSNNPSNYIRNVEQWSGVPRSKIWNWNDPDEILRLINAFIRQETSDQVSKWTIFDAYADLFPDGGPINQPGQNNSPGATYAAKNLIVPFLLLTGAGYLLLKS